MLKCPDMTKCGDKGKLSLLEVYLLCTSVINCKSHGHNTRSESARSIKENKDIKYSGAHVWSITLNIRKLHTKRVAL